MNWFLNLTGMLETTSAINENLKFEESSNNITLTSKANGNTYYVGKHSLYSHKIATYYASNQPYTKKPISVEEIIGDVKDLYIDASNEGALFQVASQFNLLEMANPTMTPVEGVSIYEHDHTQGPVSAICCGAATIYRNYIMQSTEDQINCLAEIEILLDNYKQQYWKMQNGYAMFDQTRLDQLNEHINILGRERIKNALLVGTVRDAQVTINPCTHTVDQIFCSALPVAYHMRSNFEDSDPRFERFARIILEAAYEITLATAIKNGNPIVYLTMLGGGAFGNEPEWTVDAIETALEKYKDSGLNVRIVSYGGSNPHIQHLLTRSGS